MNEPKTANERDAQEFGPTQSVRLAIDIAPLLIFFGFYLTLGIYWATAALMVATVCSIVASRVLLGHVSYSLLLTTGLVVGFGALTLWFSDARFIKVKPTIIYALFAAVLLGGLLFGKAMLQLLLGEAFRLTDKGWRILSVRFGVFFLALAVLNEIVWRNFSEAFWASFKVFGFIPLTMIFFAMQLGIIQQHQLPTAPPSPHSDG